MPTRAEKRNAKFKRAQAALPEEERLNNRTDLTRVSVRKVSPQTLEARASAKRWYLEYLETEHPSVDGKAYFTAAGPVPTVSSLKQYAVYLAQSRSGLINEKLSVFTLLHYMRATVDIIRRERGGERLFTPSEHDDLMSFIRWELSKQESLSTEMHVRTVAQGDDVTYILSVLHSSTYLATFMNMRRVLNVTIYINMMIDCCGRGGDIAQISSAEKHRHLKWKDIKLYAFSMGEDIELGGNITYNWMKGMGEDRSLYKTIPYKLMSPKLANQDTLRLLLILALMDGILDGVDSWEQLMRLDGAPTGRLIGMKQEALELPVLRMVVRHRVSDEPVLTSDMQKEISRLGRAAGIQHRLIAYSLRRGIAFTLNNEETEENRKFLMGHRTTSKAYSAYHSKISATDVAALFRKEDVRSMGNMMSICLNKSHSAPKDLSVASFNAIAEDEEFNELDEAYRRAKELVLDKFPTLAEASRACDPVFDSYKAATANRKSRLDTLTKQLQKKEYAAHFESTICEVRSVTREGGVDAGIDSDDPNRAGIDGQADDNHRDKIVFVKGTCNIDLPGMGSTLIGVQGQPNQLIGQLVEMDGDHSHSIEENGGPAGKGHASASAKTGHGGEASHTILGPDGTGDLCRRIPDKVVELSANDSNSSHAGDDDDDYSLWDPSDDDSIWGDSVAASALGEFSNDDWLGEAGDESEPSDEAKVPLPDNTDDLVTMRLHGLPTRISEYLQGPERQIKKISPNKGQRKYFVGSGLADDLLDVMTGGQMGEAELCDRARTMFSCLHPTDAFYPGEEPVSGTYSCRYCGKPLANIHHPSIHVHMCARQEAIDSARRHFDAAFPWDIRCNYQICGSQQTFGQFVQCGATFQSRIEYYTHMRGHIRGMRKTRRDKTKVLSCFFGDCASHPEDGRLHRGGPSFQTEDAQTQHLKAHHQILLRKGNPVMFCEICNLWVIDPDEMEDHAHLEEAGQIIREWGYGGVSGSRTFVPRFCPFCYHDETKSDHIRGFTFGRDAWVKHIAVHFDGMRGIARCPAHPSMCTKASGMSREQLQQHFLHVHGIRVRTNIRKTKGEKSTPSISENEGDVMTKRMRVV